MWLVERSKEQQMQKTLLFKKYDTNLPEEILKQDTIFVFRYHDPDELPVHFDPTLYNAFFFILKEVGTEEVNYIQTLRSNGNSQPIYILQKEFSGASAEKLQSITDCILFESQSLSSQKIEYILTFIKQRFDNSSVPKIIEHPVFQNIPIPTLYVSIEGKIENANRAFLSHFKYSEEYLKSLNIQALIPGLETELAVSRKQKRSLKTELSIAEPDGNMVPCHIHLFSSSHPDHLLCLIEDFTAITKQRQKLENLEITFKKFDRILNRITKSAAQTDEKKQVCSALKDVLSCDRVEQISIGERGITDLQFSIPEMSKDDEEIFKILAQRIVESETFSIYSGSTGNFKTIIAFPQISDSKIIGLVFAFYYNFIEPDPFKVRLASLLTQVCILSMSWQNVMQTVKKSEGHFKALVENAQDGIYQSAPDGHLIYVNHALLKMLGYHTFEEMQEAAVHNQLYAIPEKRAEFKAMLENSGVVYNFTEKLRRKDGSYISVIENAHIIYKEKESVIYEGIIRDVSEIKELETKIQVEHNFAQEIIDKAPVLIFAVDQKGKLVLWNRKVEEVSGYTKDEIMDKAELFSKLYPDKDYLNKVLTQTNQQLIGTLDHPLMFRLINKNGQKREISWTSKQIRSAILGNLELNFGQDLTRLALLEENIYDAYKAEVLNKLNTSLAERFKELLAEIKYVLENPSQVSSKGIIEKINTGFDLIREAQNFLQTKQLINEPFSLDKTIKQVVDIVGKTISKNIKIETNLRFYRMLMGDGNGLKQALFNVVANAVDALADGGTILVDSQLAHSDDPLPKGIQFPQYGNWALIHIKDSGIGIRAEDLPHLFEPFYSTREKDSSRGLGLTLTQKILHEHGGSIQISSEYGKGTDVYMFLPASENLHSGEKEQRIKKQKILIIDDESIIQDLIQDVLHSEGYQILSAQDGKAGLELFRLKANEIGLVILDVILPKLDGQTVFTEIRKIKPGVKVLVISGYSKSNVKEKLIQAGINAFIAKPFSIVHLLETVESLASEKSE